MNVQVIKSLEGKPEYVLLPYPVYQALRNEIEGKMAGMSESRDDYEPFLLADYVDNPVALARIQAGVTQDELARLMSVTQAYVSKIENQDKVTPKLLAKVNAALGKA